MQGFRTITPKYQSPKIHLKKESNEVGKRTQQLGPVIEESMMSNKPMKLRIKSTKALVAIWLTTFIQILTNSP